MFSMIAAMIAAAPVVAVTNANRVSEPIMAGALAGTLERPSGRVKATMLILPGSGPTDREGNNPLGVAASPYRMLADELSVRSIATIRIDKRGLFGSKAAGDPNAVTIGTYVHDTAAWVAAAGAQRERTAFDL